VLLIVDPEEFRHLKGGEAYEKRLWTVPTLAPRLAAARRASRLYRGSERELRGYFRKPYGPGWALAGDAGYYAHPAAAGGINDALRSAELLHEHVDRAWRQGLAAETFLEQFQSTRDTENEEPFYLSYRLGSVNPFRDPELAAEFRGDSSVD
jgi:flavin-dependent dehydrogenase